MEATRQDNPILEQRNLKTNQALVVALLPVAISVTLETVTEVEEEDVVVAEEAVDMEVVVEVVEEVEEALKEEGEAIHLNNANLLRLHKGVSELTARFSILPARTIQGHIQEQHQTNLLQEVLGHSLRHNQGLRNGSNLSSQTYQILDLIQAHLVAKEERSRVSLAIIANIVPPVHLIIPTRTRQIRIQFQQPTRINRIRRHHMACPTVILTQLLLPQ